ncbi:hypothetical protein [Gordoniibacillus kamchatkensis]|nr:hypothetical protein [Paenibacillus sp. VKM B-2647]
MKIAIFVLVCLGTIALSATVFAQAQAGGGTSSVTEAVYGKGEPLK